MASYRRTRLRGNPKSNNLTSRSCARPNQFPQRVAREPCGNPKSCNFTSRSYTQPRQSPQRVAREPCGNPQSCNFTSRSGARPRQSTERVARHAEKLQLYLAFARSTTPIHAKGCASRRKVANLPRVRPHDHANPRKRLRVAPKSCKKLQIYLAFGRSTTPIHAKGCIRDRWHRCWFRL